MKSQKIKLNRCENYLFNKRIGKKYSRGWFVIIKKLIINHSSLGDGGEKTKILGDDSQCNALVVFIYFIKYRVYLIELFYLCDLLMFI